jgi:uncharacterized protein YndB with AHSA1/START domain
MNTIDEPIIVEQTYNTSIETLWKAITEIDRMRQWYFDNVPSFKPEIGFETQFTVTSVDRDFPHRWKVTEVIPLKKISYNWKYDGYEGDSQVTFELSENNNQATLKLTHQVLEPFPDNIPEFTRESGIDGWEYFIQRSLKEYLEREQ